MESISWDQITGIFGMINSIFVGITAYKYKDLALMINSLFILLIFFRMAIGLLHA